jgi:hypothetical protein
LQRCAATPGKEVSHRDRRCYTSSVPTTRPRYTFTDTGELEALLDAAERRWPEIPGRKMLLLRLAEEGATSLGLEPDRPDAADARRERTRAALKTVQALVDVDVLLSDQAWR